LHNQWLTSVVPLLGGISLFCLTNRTSLFSTNLFGGSMANEGLGVLAISFDWQMIGMYLMTLTVLFEDTNVAKVAERTLFGYHSRQW
jgi:hypothetical protein